MNEPPDAHDADDITATIALWRRDKVTAFEAWKSLGNKPWQSVTWDDVFTFMKLWERGVVG